MRKLLFRILTLAALAAVSCTGDDIFITDEAFTSGGGSTTLIDPELGWSASTYTAYMGGGNTFPTLSNTHNVSVSYSSSKTGVATIGTDGTITLVAAGETIITASFAGNDTYDNVFI